MLSLSKPPPPPQDFDLINSPQQVSPDVQQQQQQDVQPVPSLQQQQNVQPPWGVQPPVQNISGKTTEQIQK